MKFVCGICNKEYRGLIDVSSELIINGHEYLMCSECMYHFREMLGKLQEERRKETENE